MLSISLTVLPPLSFYHNFSEVPMIDKSNGANLRSVQFHSLWKSNKLEDRCHCIYITWPPKSMSLYRAQLHFCVSLVGSLHCVPWWYFPHFSMFLEPLIFPSSPLLSTGNLVSNFKERMWAIIKPSLKLCQQCAIFQLWQYFLLSVINAATHGLEHSYLSFHFILSLLISFHCSNISQLKKKKAYVQTFFLPRSPSTLTCISSAIQG